ncbi:MAG: phosphoribosyl-ATP diphosphatase [Sutterellaceae bacterium]|nr:phosphoribosyl-ATP diphosphatase [Sutterellaceae bacterium]MDD7442381.1 phosphoribosyl-ATP diphosphatase [Sutterellaceae bacterium]MDY2867150.1 phosphoribosyl-ATP diphosphatase [Mesosutterella sp.]
MTESRKCGEILEEIADTIDSRHGADPSKSYVAQLFSKAPDGMLKKVAEEASEVIMAAKDVASGSGDKAHLVYETADLWFHSMVVLSCYGLRPEDVVRELARREGVSGLVEKASRKKS